MYVIEPSSRISDIQGLIGSRPNTAAHRPKGLSELAALLLWLIGIAGAASAQELPSIQLPEVGEPAEVTASAALPADALLLPRIDWLALAADDEAPEDISLRLPVLAFHQPAERPPEPTHTGFKALVFETGRDFNAFPRRRSTWVILAIGGAAAAIAHPADDEVNARLMGSDAAGRFFAAGKYIGGGYVQVGAAAGLYVIGRYVLPHAEGESKTNKVSHLGFDLIRALIVSQSLTQGIKVTVRRDRPTGECCAFPSGHASAAFATAAVLERHLGYRNAWPTLVIAGYVATSRLYDNRHFLSDVLFGAALGMASGWTVVGRHGRSNYALIPVPVRGGVMVSFTRKPSSQARR